MESVGDPVSIPCSSLLCLTMCLSLDGMNALLPHLPLHIGPSAWQEKD